MDFTPERGMDMPSPEPFINIVGLTCRPEEEAKFNAWYEGVHLPLIRPARGLLGITRYKLAPGNDPGAYPRYLSVFTFTSQADFTAFLNSPEVAASKDEMARTWGKDGLQIVWRVQYEKLPQNR